MRLIRVIENQGYCSAGISGNLEMSVNSAKAWEKAQSPGKVRENFFLSEEWKPSETPNKKYGNQTFLHECPS